MHDLFARPRVGPGPAAAGAGLLLASAAVPAPGHGRRVCTATTWTRSGRHLGLLPAAVAGAVASFTGLFQSSPT